MNKKKLLCLALAATALLCGCSGGNTTNRNSIKTVLEAKTSEYRTNTVKRGDLTLRESVRVSYFAADTENLSFPVSGLYYESIDVEVGDTVKKGDVLARLECGAIDTEIESLDSQAAALERTIQRAQAVLELLNERGASDQTKREYELTVRNANNELAVINTQLEELNAKRESRMIIAGIDGTVTYVRDIENGELSVNGRTLIGITNLDSCVFSSTLEYADMLDEDTIYTVTIDGADYELKLVEPETLGIEPEPVNEKSNRRKVYFKNLTPSVNLTDESSGKFYITIDSREDALYIPTDAVTAIDGVVSVYVPDENGLATTKKITVGLDTGTYTEVTGGLSEGDTVIIFK